MSEKLIALYYLLHGNDKKVQEVLNEKKKKRTNNFERLEK